MYPFPNRVIKVEALIFLNERFICIPGGIRVTQVRGQLHAGDRRGGVAAGTVLSVKILRAKFKYSKKILRPSAAI